jgi:hypothetical protein
MQTTTESNKTEGGEMKCQHEAAKANRDYVCRKCGKLMIVVSGKDSGAGIDGRVS